MPEQKVEFSHPLVGGIPSDKADKLSELLVSELDGSKYKIVGKQEYTFCFLTRTSTMKLHTRLKHQNKNV